MSHIRAILGGGKVANILLWKNKIISALILSALTGIWIFLEVLEYQFLTILCNTLTITMLGIFFLQQGGARLIARFGFVPPHLDDIKLSSESTCRYLFEIFNLFLLNVLEISSGKDLKLLFLAMACLWILSVIGNHISLLNLLYTIIVFGGTVPALYERYGAHLDTFAAKRIQDVKDLYRLFLNKIPRREAREE
ncbi:reticulon-like protein B14 [Pyrus ussuriensis x Pyrus communis]|uniref:Reticulon-like protein n=1 Tax=Pyrus ussuriensis x Pyrus communis TaxID=2448454 RepID=A0A5N5HFJ1_9ROSA|nr:reticulon-like protein B14 [Pyrus ussuriensis x Pyrus communis]